MIPLTRLHSMGQFCALLLRLHHLEMYAHGTLPGNLVPLQCSVLKLATQDIAL